MSCSIMTYILALQNSLYMNVVHFFYLPFCVPSTQMIDPEERDVMIFALDMAAVSDIVDVEACRRVCW